MTQRYINTSCRSESRKLDWSFRQLIVACLDLNIITAIQHSRFIRTITHLLQKWIKPSLFNVQRSISENQKIKKSQDNTIYRWQHFCLLFLFHVLRYISEISDTLNKSLKAMLSQVQFLSNWLDTENLFRKKTNSRQCQLIKIQVKKWYQYADILY